MAVFDTCPSCSGRQGNHWPRCDLHTNERCAATEAALRVVVASDGVTPEALEEALETEFIQAQVDALVADGLVEEFRVDGRRLYRLTPKGKTEVEERSPVRSPTGGAA